MNENFQKLEKKKILAILGSNREMYKMCSAKIYTSNREGDSWLYSDLEGFLCFVLDYNIKTRFFVMFDPTTYERLFQFELYNNFEREYQKLADDFFCFDVGNGFVGFKFDEPKEASELHDIIKKFNDFLVDNLFDANLKSNNVYNFKKQEIIVSYLEIIKEKFSAAKNKFNEDYIEDGMEIRKPRYFELLNNIAFDREKKEFKIGKLPQEFKNMFKNIGIKKSDIKDPKSALNIIKNVIDILDNQADDRETAQKFGKAFKETIAKLKNKKQGSIPSTQNLSGPINFNKAYGEDVNTAGGNENNTKGIENNTHNSNTIRNTNINTNANTNPNTNIPAIPSVPKLPNTNIKTTLTVVTPAVINTTQTPNESTQVNTPTKIPSIPSVPKVPAIPAVPLIPSVPKVPNIQSPNKNTDTSPSTETANKDSTNSFISKEEEISKITLKPVSSKPNNKSANMLDEMKNVVLKKIDHTVNDKKSIITKNETNHLQLSLAMAIKQRRIEITKNEVDDSNEESDGWSD